MRIPWVQRVFSRAAGIFTRKVSDTQGTVSKKRVRKDCKNSVHQWFQVPIHLSGIVDYLSLKIWDFLMFVLLFKIFLGQWKGRCKRCLFDAVFPKHVV